MAFDQISLDDDYYSVNLSKHTPATQFSSPPPTFRQSYFDCWGMSMRHKNLIFIAFWATISARSYCLGFPSVFWRRPTLVESTSLIVSMSTRGRSAIDSARFCSGVIGTPTGIHRPIGGSRRCWIASPRGRRVFCTFSFFSERSWCHRCRLMLLGFVPGFPERCAFTWRRFGC